MKFTTQVRYGMRAMVEIAKADQKIGILQKDISENQKLSIKYLDQIIHSLKIAGLIINIKGKKSGYRLTRDAREITTLDIHNAFEPEIAVTECQSEFITCELKEVCHTNSFWNGLNDHIIEYFTRVTLDDLVQRRDLSIISITEV